MATVTVAGNAGAWRATPLGATVRAATKDLGAAGLPTRSGRAAGANGAVLAVMAALAAGLCSRT